MTVASTQRRLCYLLFALHLDQWDWLPGTFYA
jgi:hypothetical protein